MTMVSSQYSPVFLVGGPQPLAIVSCAKSKCHHVHNKIVNSRHSDAMIGINLSEWLRHDHHHLAVKPKQNSDWGKTVRSVYAHRDFARTVIYAVDEAIEKKLRFCFCILAAVITDPTQWDKRSSRS